MTSPELAKAAQAFEIVQRARALQTFGASYDRSIRARDRWDGRWEAAFIGLFAQHKPDFAVLAKAGDAAWKRVEKRGPLSVIRAITRVVTAQIGSLPDFLRGAMAIYMSLARDESTDAGQATLDQLGLNETFRWTGQRDMPRDMFEVRGSKIIQHLYGSHRDRLSQIVSDATNPRSPQPVPDVTQAIEREWGRLTRSQAQRIARTETAAVWDHTAVQSQVANDVRTFEISTAKGPSIGPPTSYPVCPICIRAAAGSPYPLAELPRVPLHPNCRCVTLPVLPRDWLPPAEPWHGNDPPLPTVRTPLP